MKQIFKELSLIPLWIEDTTRTQILNLDIDSKKVSKHPLMSFEQFKSCEHIYDESTNRHVNVKKYLN